MRTQSLVTDPTVPLAIPFPRMSSATVVASGADAVDDKADPAAGASSADGAAMAIDRPIKIEGPPDISLSALTVTPQDGSDAARLIGQPAASLFAVENGVRVPRGRLRCDDGARRRSEGLACALNGRACTSLRSPPVPRPLSRRAFRNWCATTAACFSFSSRWCCHPWRLCPKPSQCR